MPGESIRNGSSVSVAAQRGERGQSPGTSTTAIIVDLDGTLTPTDTLLESLIQLSRRSPASLLKLPLWLLQGRATLKAEVCARTVLAVDRLPYRESLLAYLRKEKENGRRIILATAAHESIARAVAAHLGLFDDAFGTADGLNLKGPAKLAVCRERVGDRFSYVGDDCADMPLWTAAQSAVLVAVDPRISELVRSRVPIDREFPKEPVRMRDWLSALRIHQWLKNLLLFVPLLTAFLFNDGQKVMMMTLAFFSFSFVASATYVLNDLWDMENDRAHPRKRLRPFASGKIPIIHGLVAVAVLLTLGFVLAVTVAPGFVFMLGLYLGATIAYSVLLKDFVLIDVLTLALLYTLRILAGSVAIGIQTSSWLLVFSSFAFLSLALGKRCSELTSLEQSGTTRVQGRDYRVSDLRVLQPLGIGAALSAVVVFGLFISDPETEARYVTPQLLWLAAIELTYWLGRMWIKTSRGEMHDDPVVDTVKDPTSLITVLAMIATLLVAHFVALGGKQ